LQSWGVVPDFVMGHSIGEFAAAHLAGVFSLADACRLVASRGRLIQSLPEGGAMISIVATERELRDAIAGDAHLSIAALNGPMLGVISGDEDSVTRVADAFEALGRKVKRLAVSHAFHSHRMDAILDAFREAVAGVERAVPTLGFVSTRTGKRVEADELLDPEYWVEQLRHEVRFAQAVSTLGALGVDAFVEIGPGRTLAGMAESCVEDEVRARALFSTILRRSQPDSESVARVLGELFSRGVEIDWQAVFEPWSPQQVSLPSYPFQRRRYWLDAPTPGATGTRSPAGFRQREISSPLALRMFEISWRAQDLIAVEPARARLSPMLVVEMLCAAVGLDRHTELRALSFLRPLGLADAARTQLIFRPGPGARAGDAELHVGTQGTENNAWTLACSARLTTLDERAAIVDVREQPTPPAELTRVPYLCLGSDGGSYGLAELQRAGAGAGELTWWVEHGGGLDLGAQHLMHAAALDAVAAVIGSRATGLERSAAFVYELDGVDLLRVRGPGAATQILHIRKLEIEDDRASFDVCVINVDGHALALDMSGVRMRIGARVETTAAEVEHDARDYLLRAARKLLGVSVEPSANLVVDYGADSLAMLSLARMVESEFGVSLVQAGLPTSIDAMVAWIEARGLAPEREGVADGLLARPEGVTLTKSTETLTLADLAATSTVWTLPGDRELETVSLGHADGQPMVLLPPFNCELRAWEAVVGELARRYALTLFNYPGFGRARAGWQSIDDHQLASCVAWVMDELFERPVVLVGWSLGGFLGLRLARHRPELVDALVLTNTTACLVAARTASGTHRTVQTMHEDLQAELARLSASEAELAHARVHAGSELRPREVNRAYINLVARYDLRQSIAAIERPTLIVAGADDHATPVEDSMYMHEHIPGSKLVIVPESGHYTPLFGPRAWTQIVGDWLGATRRT
jgi:pimeloyl-ACP methyl ester carboxylesterase/malonyl CoA-acyl carrier protein transacylase